MQVEVSEFDCEILTKIINGTSFKGCDVEYVSALKEKFKVEEADDKQITFTTQG